MDLQGFQIVSCLIELPHTLAEVLTSSGSEVLAERLNSIIHAALVHPVDDRVAGVS